jgi:hypothetical protein
MASQRSKPLSFSSIKVGMPPVVTPPEDIDLGPRDVPEVEAVFAPPPAPVAASEAAPVALAPALESGVILTRIEESSRPSRAIYVLSALASLLWLGGAAALGYAYVSRSGRLELDPLALGLLALVALAPLAFIWAAAYAVSQARLLAMEAHRAKRLTDELVGPTALAAAQAGAVVEAMRGQIATASEVANQARDHLDMLRQALTQQTEQLAEATAGASRTAISLVETLSRERAELNTLSVTLDARAAAVTDAINRQARMVAEASDLAETQLREAEAALAARAADLAAAAGEAVDVSRVATEDLDRQVGRLEVAGTGVGDQARALEDGLTQQRAALVTVAHALRAEQEDFATLVESSTAQLAEFIASSRTDVVSMNEATTAGSKALSDLIAEARGKFRELAEAATEERDAFAKSAEDTLKGLSEAGGREREHLEAAMRSTIEALSAAAAEAREAADVHAEAARARVDLLNEAAFAAGQKADQVFEARLTEARGLIEQSAKLVEDAGALAAAKLEAQITASRGTLDGLNEQIEALAQRTAKLPEEASAQAEKISQAIEGGLAELSASARRAAEETQAIDAAFQDRVRRNYEMLSEAVQLMGVVASGGPGVSVLQRPTPAQRAKSRIAAAAPTPANADAPPALPSPDAAPSGEPNLRGRLKLTATAADEEYKAVFDTAAAPASTDDRAWTWKELLTSIDGEGAVDDAKLGEALFEEIASMGIDPAALLPRARIDEIAAVIQAGDASGAREVVRTLAPAATRRITRRLMSDATFRARCQTLVQRYSDVVAEAVRRDRQGLQAADLLASNVGRAYLLLDAASSQPA